MKQVYLAHDATEAHLLTEMLSAVGIKARVQGEHISTLQGAVPFGTATAPSVWVVDDEDSEEAQQQIRDFLQGRQRARSTRVWVCPRCDEVIEPQFTACWSCGAERGDAPLVPAKQRDLELTEGEVAPADAECTSCKSQLLPATTTGVTFELWIETSVVLIVTVLPSIFGAFASLLWRQGDWKYPSLHDQLYSIMRAVWDGVPVLYVIWRSGESWATFGLSRPRIVKDGLAGILIWMAIVTARSTALYMIAQLLGIEALAALGDLARNVFARPVGAEYLLVPFSSCAIGFVEELVIRGYLIPRFERCSGHRGKRYS